jgi:hypothetical protein
MPNFNVVAKNGLVGHYIILYFGNYARFTDFVPVV